MYSRSEVMDFEEAAAVNARRTAPGIVEAGLFKLLWTQRQLFQVANSSLAQLRRAGYSRGVPSIDDD